MVSNSIDSDVKRLFKLLPFVVVLVVQRQEGLKLPFNLSSISCVSSLTFSPHHFLNSSFTQKGIRISHSPFSSFHMCFGKSVTRSLCSSICKLSVKCLMRSQETGKTTQLCRSLHFEHFQKLLYLPKLDFLFDAFLSFSENCRN